MFRKRMYLVAMTVVAMMLSECFGQESRIVRGKIDGATDHPIHVAKLWRANGDGRDKDGKLLDLTDQRQLALFWGRVGEMQPVPSKRESLCSSKGEFQLEVSWRCRALMAMDDKRQRGAIIELPKANGGETEHIVTLQPAEVVRGILTTKAPNKSVAWGHVYVELLPRDDRPLAVNRLISCGTLEGNIEFRLPPGKYQIEAYGTSDRESDDLDLVSSHRRIPFEVIPGQTTELGEIRLVDAPQGIAELKAKAKKDGRWHDVSQHYGEAAPEWHASESRGFLDDNCRLESLRGKWVVVYFWGLSCAPCLKRGVPKMIEFYERNKHLRAKFEIVGVCISYDNDAKDLKHLDQQLKPIVKNVWQGKFINFPVVLDRTFKSWERYGIAGLGTTVLVDPDGNLFKGDLDTLQAMLTSKVEFSK